MSAWAELVNVDGSDEHLALCSRALVEVQAETLRRAARRAEAENPDRDADFSAGVDWVIGLLRGHADGLEGGAR